MTAYCCTADDKIIDPLDLRRTMSRFATGVTVVTTCVNGKPEGVTANSFATVSLDPPLILWSLGRRARSFDAFSGATHFAINVLASDQLALCRNFAMPRPDKFDGVRYSLGIGDCPLLPEVIAQFECCTEQRVDAGDHVVFIGRVLNATHAPGEPLVFADGEFHRPDGLTEAETA
jgi:flavin reductase (DIM6/NTAB) family NADH-FMN oxidoreductase RutF